MSRMMLMSKASAPKSMETAHLASFIQEHFPEEAISVDLSEPSEVLNLAMKLLGRLWRWEN